ncbi:hypothetical protein JQC91_17290 [Jannaschia sp. Os4]|uniref:hypothetical protein n=1 Tax=Jannaschia sp. Os4 TaxID=2807617 RepID=UPI0019393E53|nr:hypothetical protein [Jannaschia sp. Os4]MBM2578064.1 hypothetical protein [Jannaschia sp. Os4]
MRGFAAIIALAAACAGGSGAAADGARLAWLVGDAGAPAGAADAVVGLSRAFLTAGWDVRRVSADAAPSALSAPRGARVVIVAADPSAISAPAAALRARGAREVLLIGAACRDADEAGEVAGDWAGDGAVAMLAPERGADGACPEVDLPAVVRAGLAEGGVAAMEPLVLRGGFGPLRAAPARREAAPVVIGGGPVAPSRPAAGGGGVVIGRAAAAVTIGSASLGGVATGRVQPVALRPGGASLSIGTVTQPAALLSARAPEAGLPRPSIIVGRLPGAEDGAPVDEGGALAGEGVDVDGYAARERLRAADPENYARLVAQGVFDPLPEAVPAALQTALQRMGCYRLAIDGDWGNGSRGAVDRYYAQRGGAAPTREAQVALFRDVILREDIECPAPVVAAAPRRAAPAATTTRRAAPARTQARQAAPARTAPARAAPAPAPSGGGRINPTFSGAFR